MLMTEYETTVIVRPDVTGEQVESALDRMRDVISKRGGKLLEIDHWGKKKLAYLMNRHPRGIFVRTHYLGLGDLVGEIERNLRLNENVLRFLTIKMQERVEADERNAKEYVVPSYDEPDEPEESGESFGHDDDGEHGHQDNIDRGYPGRYDVPPEDNEEDSSKSADGDATEHPSTHNRAGEE